ncbi:uncharacterized protein LOC107398255 [Tribolium castaneum]|uniref:Uncharacterized protein n=1 Tax=Tribolium castaneum TaxID=7070 RepID=D6WQJ2_TRICA|nr:PREDICTED: uncharacterized protein LOC107398255 [Tribolium castaneum]EFA06065.1 hypothetical protein TcasGA2_TC008900 [Tribolium castaneum]|eukprot:XP_015837234.1 PREDICTED: uncharacterized protein LOC107398255 [Tribolium castaneum]
MNRLVSLPTKRFLSHFIRASKISKPTSFKTEKRHIQSCSQNYRMPKTPDLIYVPHVFRWVKSKLRFKYLKKIWDPEFSEGAFIYGSTKAVCKITEIISSGRLDELDGLMTVSAKIRLQDDVTYRLNPTQRNLILLKPEDIKILIPITVTLAKEGAGRMCRVNLRILGLKWHEVTSDNYKLVLVALQTEFSRDYSEEATPEWIISGFSILECAMLTEATATR